MYGIVAGLVLLGTVCGATIRLIPFVIVLVIAAAVAIVTGLASSDGAPLFDAVITIVSLQVGYACGIVARAMLRPRHSGRSDVLGRQSDRHGIPSPTEQKPR
jgi:hypothetical protein